MATSVRAATILACLVLSVSSCGADAGDGPTRAPTSPSASPSPSVPAASRSESLRVARRTLVAFVDAWRDRGLELAAQQYLAKGSRPPSGVGTPRLLSGTIGHAEITSWESPDHFTFSVDLDLHFAGDPLAWNEGRNTRFVTAVRPDGGAAFELAFATSP